MMDFRSLLQSMTSLSEATKETGKGRIHTAEPGGYGRKDDEDADGNPIKPASTGEKRGRGRPKKDADASGEVKSYDTTSLGSAFGAGQKPKGVVGKVSAKHRLKDWIEATEDALNESEEKSYTCVHAKKGKCTVTANTSYEAAKKAAAKWKLNGTSGIDAHLNTLKSASSLEEAEALTIKPMPGAQQITDPTGKSLGTADAATANIIKQAAAQGKLTLGGSDDEMAEGKDEGKPGKNFAKIAKSAGKHYGSKAAGERVAGAVRAKLAKQGKLEEANTTSLDSVILEGAMKSLVTNLFDSLTTGEPGYNISPAVDAQDKALATRIIDKTLAHDDRYKRLAHTLKSQLRDAALEEFGFTEYESSLEEADSLPATSSKIAHTQHGLDARPSKLVSINPNQKPTPFSVDPIQATTDRAGSFIRSIMAPKKSNPFESTDMKDVQLESWESQLNSLLTEGITVSSSTGQQGSPDSVSVNATDADATELLNVLRQAGVGVFGGQEQSSQYGAPMNGVSTGSGAEPEMSPTVVDDGDGMMALIKKMSGIQDGSAPAEPEGTLSADYADEEGSEEEQSYDSEEESDEEESGEEEEEVTDEGNAFGQEVRQKKSDNIPDSQQRIKTGGQNLPVKEEEDEEQEHEACGTCHQTTCECDEQVEEGYANEAGHEELAKLKALLSMGSDMHRPKQSQATGNIQKVTMETKLMKETSSLLADYKKLSGM